MEIRAATVADAEAIRGIYNVEVETSTATFDLVARSLEQQQEWLSVRSGVLACIVAIERSEVFGFASISPYKERPAYRTTVEDSVYVRRDAQGKGVGRDLLGAIIDRAVSHGFHAVMARIEASRSPSIALHRSLGFTLVGIEREVGRKFGRWLDVALMQRML